ncbi:type II secretion system protein GspJ [Bdellovibrionota bacterium FG-2]
MNLNLRSSHQGFSLLEVMIAMAILVFITIGITQATSETFKLRDVLLNEGDFYNGIRLATDILQRDICQMYSPIAMIPPRAKNAPEPDPAEAEALLAGDLAQTTAFWLGAVEKNGIRPSRFVGKQDEISFISLSHVRIYKDAPESEFAKIRYKLIKEDKPPFGAKTTQSTSVLTKIETTNAFDEDERRDKKLENTYPLLRGITSLTFQFYNKEKDTWERSWDSEKEDTHYLFPDSIEMKFEIVGPSKLSFTGVYYFKPEVPIAGFDATY